MRIGFFSAILDDAMFLLSKPDAASLESIRLEMSKGVFSYPAVGATDGKLPKEYNVDRNQTLLGHGEDIYAKAVDAVKNWKMFDLEWIELFPAHAPIQAGTTVVVIVNHLGFYSINPNRIVYTFDEAGEVSRFGFAYGTVEGHAESGEERFSVEFDSATGEVRYHILAFSRPQHTLAKLGYPYTRYLQRQFALASMEAMRKSVL